MPAKVSAAAAAAAQIHRSADGGLLKCSASSSERECTEV